MAQRGDGLAWSPTSQGLSRAPQSDFLNPDCAPSPQLRARARFLESRAHTRAARVSQSHFNNLLSQPPSSLQTSTTPFCR